MTLKEFNDNSLVKCNICQEKQSKDNLMFVCVNCKINVCSYCKNSHEKGNEGHKLVEYDKVNFLCDLHSEKNIFYCKECKKNICDLCADEHDTTHNLIYLKGLLDDKPISKSFKNMLTKMDIFKNDIQNIIDK